MSNSERVELIYNAPKGGIAIELGVAEGGFSKEILKKGWFHHLYSIDSWNDPNSIHDYRQYIRAIHNLSPWYRHNTIVRMKFHEALEMFRPQSIDFIYVDGYAHTGEEGGKTMRDWWDKLKPGGIMAGDDYSPEWPLVLRSVHNFVSDYGLDLHIHQHGDTHKEYCKYPSWWVKKVNNVR